LDGKAPLTKREKGSSLGGIRKPAMSGSVEVGSGAHMSRKDARTGRIATVRRSGVMYAIAPVMRGTFRCACSARAVHAVYAQRRHHKFIRAAIAPGARLRSHTATRSPRARRLPMRKGSGTPTASMQMSIGKAHQPKKQPMATDHTCRWHRN
jgi:hypothetical protein